MSSPARELLAAGEAITAIGRALVRLPPPGIVGRVFLCIEADDFTSPRGIDLLTGERVCFSALDAGGDGPGNVREGRAYLVDARNHHAIGELLASVPLNDQQVAGLNRRRPISPATLRRLRLWFGVDRRPGSTS